MPTELCKINSMYHKSDVSFPFDVFSVTKVAINVYCTTILSILISTYSVWKYLPCVFFFYFLFSHHLAIMVGRIMALQRYPHPKHFNLRTGYLTWKKKLSRIRVKDFEMGILKNGEHFPGCSQSQGDVTIEDKHRSMYHWWLWRQRKGVIRQETQGSL